MTFQKRVLILLFAFILCAISVTAAPTDLAPNMQSCWDFQNNNSEFIYDYAPNTETNLEVITGKVGNGLGCGPGSTALWSTQSEIEKWMLGNTDWTVVMWLKKNNTNSLENMIQTQSNYHLTTRWTSDGGGSHYGYTTLYNSTGSAQVSNGYRDSTATIEEWNLTIFRFNSTSKDLEFIGDNGNIIKTFNIPNLDAIRGYNGFPFQICANSYSGKIDEVRFYNKTLTATEIQEEWNGGAAITCSDILPTGETYTSIKHFDYSINNVTFDSSIPLTISNQTFNSSTSQSMYSRGSMNLIKFNHPATVTMSMIEDVNEIELYDQAIRSMSLTSGYGIANKPITESTLNVGANNQTLQVYDSAQGGVSIENFEVHNIVNQSKLNNDINMESQEIDFTYSSATITNVTTFSFIKSLATGTIIDIVHKFSATGETSPTCYVNASGETSANYGSFISGSGVTRSSGVAYEIVANNTITNFTIHCNNTLGETVTNNLTIHLAATADKSGALISSMSAKNSGGVYTAGTHVLLNLTDYEVLGDGDEIETIITVVFKSLSGSQTPSIYMSLNNSNSAIMHRALQDNDDIATGKLYNAFDFSLGDRLNGTINLIVPSGEIVEIISASGVLFEATKLNITAGNLPPIVLIISPSNGSNVSGTGGSITYIATDPNEQVLVCNTTFWNEDGTLNTTLADPSTSPVNINWSDYIPGNYSINVSCEDPLSLTNSDVSFINIIGLPFVWLFEDIGIEWLLINWSSG